MLCGHAYSFDRELAPTHVEEILETGAEKVDNENIVETFLPKMINLGDTDCDNCQSGTTRCDREDILVPFKMRYDRHSSRSRGVSDLRGS